MVEIKQVVDKLDQLTKQGQVPWKLTADESTFSATFGRMSVLISRTAPSFLGESSSYKLSVLDEKGNEIDFAMDKPTLLSTGPGFPVLVTLYTSAKRTALGVDERLEELMNEMDRVSGS